MEIENQQVPEGGITDDTPKGDSLQDIREWGDNWKKTATEYKATADFVNEKFGDLSSAELAHSIYSSFAGEEFDPTAFSKLLEQMSPERAGKLVENLASERASKMVPDKVQELFGGQVSQEEITLFKKWKESGYAFGEGDDIPDSLKVDKDGNPLNEETIEFLRNLKSQVDGMVSSRRSSEDSAKAQAEAEREAAIQASINEFGAGRLKILDSEFEAMGLAPSKDDNTEVATEKEFLRQFLVHGVSGMFLADQEASKDYQSAVGHIAKGENLLARRYEPRIEKKLVEILRGGFLKKFRDALAPEKKADPRPDISNSGGAADLGRKPQSREEWIKSLYDRGLLKS